MKEYFDKILLKLIMVSVIGLVIPNALWAASGFYRFAIPWESGWKYGKKLVISGDGLVGAGTLYCNSPTDDYAYRTDCPFRITKEDGISELLQSSVLNVNIADANYDGSVLVGRGDCGPPSMCELLNDIMLWTDGQGWERLQSEDIPYETYGEATSVSDDGSTVVGRLGYYIGVDSVFIWKESTGMVDLGLPSQECGGLADRFLQISGNAETLAIGCEDLYGAGDELISEEGLVRWTEQNGFERLGQGFPTDISTDGSAIVGVTPDGEAFRYTDAEGFREIGVFQPSAATADCSIVVGDQYVWDEQNGLLDIQDYLKSKGLDINSEYWVFDSVDDISDDGLTIIGVGHQTSGTSPRGWIATLDAGLASWITETHGSPRLEAGVLRTRRPVSMVWIMSTPTAATALPRPPSHLKSLPTATTRLPHNGRHIGPVRWMRLIL